VIVCLLPGAWRYFLHIVLSLLTIRYGFQKFYTMSALEQRGRDAPAVYDKLVTCVCLSDRVAWWASMHYHYMIEAGKSCEGLQLTAKYTSSSLASLRRRALAQRCQLQRRVTNSPQAHSTARSEL
jgi:hypothetical protein